MAAKPTDIFKEISDIFAASIPYAKPKKLTPAVPPIKPAPKPSPNPPVTPFPAPKPPKPAATYPVADRGEWYSDADYEARGGKLTWMHPKNYLGRVRPLTIDKISRDNINDLKEHISSGKTLDPLAIYPDGSEDGRHRAHAAKELGIESVPVLMFPKNLRPGEIDDQGGRFEPPTQPDLGEFVVNAYKQEYGEPSEQMTEATGWLLGDGRSVNLGGPQSGWMRGEDHRGSLPTSEAMRRWGWPEETYENRNAALDELIRRSGMVRIMTSSGGKHGTLAVNFAGRLTGKQRESIMNHIIENQPKDIIFDVLTPEGRKSQEFGPGDAAEIEHWMQRVGRTSYARAKEGVDRFAAGMKPIIPKLGAPPKLPEPFPPDTKTMSEPHPEGKARPVVPKALRAGNPDTLHLRIPRPKKPRYKLQVPIQEAFNRAYDDIQKQIDSVTHPEDKERYREDLAQLEAAFVSGNERLLITVLENTIPHTTFNHLVQSLKDEEKTMTSKKGLFARTQADMFAYGEFTDMFSSGMLKPAKQSSSLMKGVESHATGAPHKRPTDIGMTPPTKLEAEVPKPAKSANKQFFEDRLKDRQPAPAIEYAPHNKKGAHPPPKRAEDPWWHEVPHTSWLKHADEINRTKIDSGINGAWHIELAGEHPQSTYSAIWKDSGDDQTALARPQTIPSGNPHGHETAAWELSHILDIGGLVPPTVSRSSNGRIGSAQHWVQDQEKARNSSQPFGPPGNSQFPLAAAFDAATMNTDRHMGNWLVDPQHGGLTLIDHGLLFPHTHSKELKGNSEILGKAIKDGIPVPKEAVEWVKQWPHIERSLKRNGLMDDQIKLTKSRLESLAQSAQNGETFAQWVIRSGIGANYRLKGATL